MWDCPKGRLVWARPGVRELKARVWQAGDDWMSFVKVFPRPVGATRALEDYLAALKCEKEPTGEVFPVYLSPVDLRAFRKALQEEGKEELLATWSGWRENFWGPLPAKVRLVVKVHDSRGRRSPRKERMAAEELTERLRAQGVAQVNHLPTWSDAGLPRSRGSPSRYPRGERFFQLTPGLPRRPQGPELAGHPPVHLEEEVEEGEGQGAEEEGGEDPYEKAGEEAEVVSALQVHANIVVWRATRR